MPGKPHTTAWCSVCGEKVTDGRHLVRGGKPICISCAEGSYYELLLKDDISPVLTKTLLELFWKKYDAQNGKAISPLVISKYEQIENAKQAEAMQQMKLESVDEIDWTL